MSPRTGRRRAPRGRRRPVCPRRASRRTHRPAPRYPCRPEGAPQAGLLAQDDVLRVLGARLPDLFLDHVRRQPHGGGRQRRVGAVVREPALPVQPGREVRPERLLHRMRPVERRHPSLRVGAAQDDEAEAHRCDVLALEPGQPGVVPVGVRGLPRSPASPATWRRTRPGRAPRAAPRGRRRRTPAASRRRARASPRRRGAPSWPAVTSVPPAVEQCAGASPASRAPSVVEGQPAVTVGVRPARDHERRVADERSNGSPADRLEQVALAQLDVDLGQRGGQPRQLQRPRRHVGADDGSLCRLACRACTPQPVPMSRVRADRLARRELGERRGRPADTEHVVVGRRPVDAVQAGAEVGDDPPAGAVGCVVLTGRL